MKLPFEYRKSLRVYDNLACKMWDLVNDDNVDPRVRVGATNAIITATDKKMNLLIRKEQNHS
ncbi:MAG: hypothetical protein WA941_08215 [Nitrososphaeraceae archaeon]